MIFGYVLSFISLEYNINMIMNYEYDYEYD